jgi:hypothetical protein
MPRLYRLLKVCFLYVLIFQACEKDDICIEGTPGTPRMVVRFLDQENPSTFKALSNIQIQGVGKENVYSSQNIDSIALPLDLGKGFTRYAFILPSSTATNTVADTLEFNYSRKDRYLNRACGIISELILAPTAVIPINSPQWFQGYTVILDTLSNENQAHLAIYH